jgi:hypothetical protein
MKRQLPHLLVWHLLLGVISLLPGDAHAQVRGYEVTRREFFTQCISNGASLEGMRGHYLSAVVRGATENSLISGTVSYRGVAQPMTNEGGLLVHDQQVEQPALPGAYIFRLATTIGTETRTVNLPATARRIAPARVLNLEDAQSIDPDHPFELRISPLKGGGAKDQFHFRIFHPTDGPVLTLRLAAGDTRIVVPSSTLARDTNYTAYIDIIHPFAIIPPRNGGAYAVSAESRSTRFQLKTVKPAGEIQFVTNQFLARESGGPAIIPVRRGHASGTVTVDYYIEGLTAQPGINFTPTSGTLTFAEGVTDQIIAVPLLNDGVDTGPLIARAWLTNVTGGATLPQARWNDWSIAGATDPAAAVNAVMLAKVGFYRQHDGDTAPDQLDKCAPARFFASAQPSYPGAIASAQVQLPAGSSRNLVEPVQTFLEYNEDFPSRTAMDKLFRSGGYFLSVQRPDGATEAFTLRMTREPRYSVPRLSNWAAAQEIDSALPFELQWEPFTGAGPDDQVAIGIQDSNGDVIVQLPEVFDATVLAATNTAWTIPANTLRRGERYHVNLSFRKVTQLKTLPTGTRSCTVFVHSTGIWIQTAPAPGGAAASSQRVVDCCGISAIKRAK